VTAPTALDFFGDESPRGLDNYARG
jgi:hypothetical protein